MQPREPQKILSRRRNVDNELEYLVQWKGQPVQDSSWQHSRLLDNWLEVVIEYQEQRLNGCELEELDESLADQIITEDNIGQYCQQSKQTSREDKQALKCEEPIQAPSCTAPKVSTISQNPILKQQPFRPPSSKFYKPGLPGSKPILINVRPAAPLRASSSSVQPPLNVVIDYLCRKNGSHLYSVQGNNSPAIVMTAAEVRSLYPAELIAFYNKEIARLWSPSQQSSQQ